MTTRTQHQSALRRVKAALMPAAFLTLAMSVFAADGQRSQQPASAAQTAPTPRQAFEVVSIRPLDPRAWDNAGQDWVYPSNLFTLRKANLKLLINLAYGTGNITGGPDWVGSQFYAVNAKTEGNALLTQKQMQPLLQNLLAERFHLKIHHVQTIEPGYALVVAPGGPKLQPTKGGPYSGRNSACEFKYQNDSVENFGKAIGHWSLKQPVVDRTGLNGMYDFDLKFFPEDNPNTDDPTCSHAPDIFTAMQKQLGLKLVPQKVPVDSIVIDQAEKPVPD